MIHIKVIYTIKEDADKGFVKGIIREFINQIKANEAETVTYRSFWETDNPRQFFHLMSFENEEAHQKHRNSAYCNDFVSQLYPLCEEAPEAINLGEVF